MGKTGVMGAFEELVLVFPNGLAGIYDDYVKRPVLKLFSRSGGGSKPAPATAAPAAEHRPEDPLRGPQPAPNPAE